MSNNPQIPVDKKVTSSFRSIQLLIIILCLLLISSLYLIWTFIPQNILTYMQKDWLLNITLIILALLSILGIILPSILSNILKASITTPLQKIGKILSKVATGNLNVEVDKNLMNTNDEISEIAGYTRMMIINLRYQLSNIKSMDDINKLFAFFKLDYKKARLAILDLAITDHKDFVKKLINLVNNTLEINTGTLPDHHGCRLGLWYDTIGSRDFCHLASFNKLKEPHREIHAIASKIVKEWNEGDKKVAKQLISELQNVSTQVVSIIEEMKNSN